jgi:tRNA threonylcarbamoyladenosine biosynthesis protein TsaB
MLLLSVDTSGKHGSIALARCGPEADCSVIEVVPLDGGTFSAQLVPQIAALLAKHGLNKLEIGAFVVVSGPGSFTGLRIGLAAIKALAEVFSKPIAAVSLLEAIAVASGQQGKVMAVLDAGRGDVYAGEYHVEGSEAQLVRERLLTRSELMETAIGSVVVTADRSPDQVARDASLQVKEIELPGSDAIARLGWRKILAGKTLSPVELDANYIRRSGELFSKGSSSF